MTQLQADLVYALDPMNAQTSDNNVSGKRYGVAFGKTTLDYKFDYALGNTAIVGTAEDSGYHFKIHIIRNVGIRVAVDEKCNNAVPAESIPLYPYGRSSIRQVMMQLSVGLTFDVAINNAQ